MTQVLNASGPSVSKMWERIKKKDIVKMTAKYSNAPSLVPEANFTQSGAASITAAPASFSSGRHHLHNETLPRQQSPNKHGSRQSWVEDIEVARLHALNAALQTCVLWPRQRKMHADTQLIIKWKGKGNSKLVPPIVFLNKFVIWITFY